MLDRWALHLAVSPAPVLFATCFLLFVESTVGVIKDHISDLILCFDLGLGLLLGGGGLNHVIILLRSAGLMWSSLNCYPWAIMCLESPLKAFTA